MSERDDPSRPEQEIIPPGQPTQWQDGRAAKNQPRGFVWTSAGPGVRSAQFQFHRPGPLGLFIIFLALAAAAGLALLLFVGLAVILVPVLGALILIGIVAGIVRRL